MLANASPLSGLHKLAVTICARKKAPACPPGVPTLDPTPSIGKENAGPVLPLLDTSAADYNSAKKSLMGVDKPVPGQHTGDMPGRAAAGLPMCSACSRCRCINALKMHVRQLAWHTLLLTVTTCK